MVWGAIIGAAAGIYGANQQKKSNQASINAMSEIANRPQKTALGSYFNPGGMSGLAPSIQQGRMGIMGQYPQYRSQLTGATNNYLGGLGREYQNLTGQQQNPFLSMMSFGGMSTPRPTIMDMPNKADFMTRGPSEQDYISQYLAVNKPAWSAAGGAVGKAKAFYARMYGGQTLSSDYSQAMERYNASKLAAEQWDQQNAQAEAQRQAAEQQWGGPSGQPGGLQQNALQAALNPIKERAAQEYAAQQRGFGRRGLSGSSLASNQLANTQSMFGRQITDATAQVQQQQLAQRLGINEAALNASTGLVNNLANLDHQQLGVLSQQAAEQLNLLGLSQAQVGALMQPFSLAMQNNQGYWGQLGRVAMTSGDMFGGNSLFPSTNNAMNNGRYERGSA